jgi:hypothetical protein
MVGAGEALAVGRVLPFQGGDGFIGPSPQGVALGCRVSAPLARNSHRIKLGLKQRLRRETI